MGRAVLIMVVGMTLIPFGDTASKLLSGSEGVHPFFIAWTRFAIGAVCVLPFVDRAVLAAFKHPLVWVRGVLLALGITAITFALRTTDLATAFGGLFFAPIVSFAVAAVVLREAVTAPRIILITLGFVGVLLVAQPGLEFTSGKAAALLAGTCYGLFLTASRAAAPLASSKALLFSQLIIAALLTLPFGVGHVPELTATIAGLTLWSGVASMLGNLCLILAYARAPATRLAPLVYFQLIAAFGLGWMVFGQVPNPLAQAGLFLIAASGFATLALRR